MATYPFEPFVVAVYSHSVTMRKANSELSATPGSALKSTDRLVKFEFSVAAAAKSRKVTPPDANEALAAQIVSGAPADVFAAASPATSATAPAPQELISTPAATSTGTYIVTVAIARVKDKGHTQTGKRYPFTVESALRRAREISCSWSAL